MLDNSKYKIEPANASACNRVPSSRGKESRRRQQCEKAPRANYIWIYPNLMINMYDGVMDTNLVIPRGVDKTEVIFDYYFADVSKSSREKNFGQHCRQRTDSVGKMLRSVSRSNAV